LGLGLRPGWFHTREALFDFPSLFCYNLTRCREGKFEGGVLRTTSIRWAIIVAVWLLAFAILALSGCGRIIQPPTPTTVAGAPATPTDTPRPTATRRATFTPVPATPSDTPTPTVTPTPIIYRIKQGDTLLAISREFGVTVKSVQDINGINDPRRLRVGQEIIIPPKPEGEEGKPTVVPSPTPVALRIQGLAFHSTPANSLWCLGEVVNLSGQPAEEVQVEVSLHDEQGQLLASGTTFTQLDILAPRGRTPFALLFDAPPTSFAQYQTRVLSGVPHTHLGPRYPDLEIVEEWGGWLDDNNYQVRGKVHNKGEADAERVAVIVTVYDEEGHVVGARTVGIAADVFLVGAMAPFEVTITPFGSVDRYDVQVQGWWIGYQVPVATEPPEDTPAP
jgi:LysM repeat protein